MGFFFIEWIYFITISKIITQFPLIFKTKYKKIGKENIKNIIMSSNLIISVNTTVFKINTRLPYKAIFRN